MAFWPQFPMQRLHKPQKTAVAWCETNNWQPNAALHSLFAGPPQLFGPRSDLESPRDTALQLGKANSVVLEVPNSINQQT